MKYRKLGRTGLDVSLIGLGTMTWGNQNTQAEGFEQMDYALTQGINFFDTAEMYAVPPSRETCGATETIIGNWFKQRGQRDQVILASKIAGPGLEWIREGKNYIDKSNIHAAVEASLSRLQTDYIDLYQLHWPNRGAYHFGRVWEYALSFAAKAEVENFLECLQVFDELITAGKIRHIGLSNETAWGVMKWLQLSEQYSLPRIASIQNEYSLLCRNFEPDLSEISLSEDCGLLAWSPLTRGILTGKYLNGAQPKGTRLTLETRVEHRSGPQTDAATQDYIALAQRYDLDPCQMAIAFVNQQPFVTSTLIGATSMEQLRSNIDSINITLSDEIMNEIAQLRRQYPLLF